jgi:hypothetical protein
MINELVSIKTLKNGIRFCSDLTQFHFIGVVTDKNEVCIHMDVYHIVAGDGDGKGGEYYNIEDENDDGKFLSFYLKWDGMSEIYFREDFVLSGKSGFELISKLLLELFDYASKNIDYDFEMGA